ncbi:hypothetical protein Q4575_05485 [Psychrosphaera sp. 1_MG-2023]|uniref:hypothetical protein n=1 Tax=Psychrosphaera sp. 1_MG-2023 TaxID=3062643 RepID=UPI0026E35642|nr:hypothetical protein [Psychrosphaera sp. 1_MG-2023]MDO6718843.1 hypothetical protein [Psychrosphaera sp. 1_MG-2023]
MFAVFGMSLRLAKKELDKKLSNPNSKFTRSYRELPEDEQKALYEKEANRLLQNMSLKQVSAEMSAPEFVLELKKEMEKSGLYRDLEIRCKQAALNKDGTIKRAKKTNKVSLKWVSYSEYLQNKEAA